MSASAKKKLRKEQSTSQMTEKQLNEQKEAKKLKIYTTVFVVAIAAVLVAGLVFAGMNIYNKSGIVEKNMVAATINDEELNSVQLSYYYVDTVNANLSQWSNTYGESLSLFLNLMGIDPTLPLSEQSYNEEITWADYFIESALEQAKSEYMLAAAAEAEGFALSETELQAVENTISTVSMYAMLYGYNDLGTYLKANYGPGADEASYRAYQEKSVLAATYYEAHQNDLVIDDAAIREYEDGRYDEFSSYSFATYHLGYKDYLTGGTEAEDGTMVYTAEEEDAARAAAKADAELLAQATTVEELDKAIAALAINEGSLTASSSVFNNSLYSTISTIYRDWLTDHSRKDGDCEAIAYESVVTDEAGNESTVVNDYYTVMFLGSKNNETKMANVRHILVNFQGGTTDDLGNTTYSDEEKATAKAAAEEILAEMTADGTVTEEEFSDMAINKSADTGSASTGGLFENVTPEDGVYVDEFRDWAMDPTRAAGDVDIIETVYGYHIMYYVGDAEMNYRDYMISEAIRSDRMTEWYDGVVAGAVATVMDSSRLNKDIVLNVA